MAAASGDLNQCSVCFFTSDDFEFFSRHLCVDDNGNIAPPDAPISKLKTNQNDLNNKLLTPCIVVSGIRIPAIVNMLKLAISNVVISKKNLAFLPYLNHVIVVLQDIVCKLEVVKKLGKKQEPGAPNENIVQNHLT